MLYFIGFIWYKISLCNLLNVCLCVRACARVIESVLKTINIVLKSKNHQNIPLSKETLRENQFKVTVDKLLIQNSN